jgi:2'-5' RNA ligase
LYEKGYKTDKRNLKFHLTLGRIKKELSYYEIDNFLKANPKFDNFTVNDITFFKSFLTPKGPIYTPLENYNLK